MWYTITTVWRLILRVICYVRGTMYILWHTSWRPTLRVIYYVRTMTHFMEAYNVTQSYILCTAYATLLRKCTIKLKWYTITHYTALYGGLLSEWYAMHVLWHTLWRPTLWVIYYVCTMTHFMEAYSLSDILCNNYDTLYGGLLSEWYTMHVLWHTLWRPTLRVIYYVRTMTHFMEAYNVTQSYNYVCTMLHC